MKKRFTPPSIFVLSSVRGFTLIELLVAMAISSIIAAVLYSFLGTVLKSKDQADLFSEDLAKLQKVLIIMQRDIEQIVNRSTRDDFGELRASFRLKGGTELDFIRTGWTLPPFVIAQRSELQQVRYFQRDDQLIRYHWIAPDITSSAAPVETILLTDIEDFELQVAPQGGEATDTWPPLSQVEYDSNGEPILQRSELPSLLQVSFTHSRYGKLQRTFQLVQLGGEPQVFEDTGDAPGQGNNESSDGDDFSDDSGDDSEAFDDEGEADSEEENNIKVL